MKIFNYLGKGYVTPAEEIMKSYNYPFREYLRSIKEIE